jgi:hypothetical protein
MLGMEQGSPDPSEAEDTSASSGHANTGDPSNGRSSSADIKHLGNIEDDGEIDKTALVEVFEEMANESHSNQSSQGLKKNCHLCGMHSTRMRKQCRKRSSATFQTALCTYPFSCAGAELMWMRCAQPRRHIFSAFFLFMHLKDVCACKRVQGYRTQ